MLWVYKNTGFHADVNNFNMGKSCEKIQGQKLLRRKIVCRVTIFCKEVSNLVIFIKHCLTHIKF
jgi:hypothetical protein